MNAPSTAADRDPARAGSPWRPVAAAVAIALGATGAIASIRLGLPWWVGAAAAGLAGALTVLALPSVPTRAATVVVLGVGALGAARHASLPGVSTTLVALWALATLFALLLVDRADSDEVEPMAGAPPPRLSDTLRLGVMLAVIVAVVTVALVPIATEAFQPDLSAGSDPTRGDAESAAASLVAGDRLDMTSRPRLSDQVVFTVDSPRPDFWRGETYDQWDGSSWTRSDPRYGRAFPNGSGTPIPIDANDDGARSGEEMKQTFRVEASFSNVFFAAPSPVEIDTTKRIWARPDGTQFTFEGMGKGTTYTVTSRSALATAQSLQAAGEQAVPSDVLARYAQRPYASGRVHDLARQITAAAPTTYDKIVAIENWLGANTKYSLDAPIAPRGTPDVVDHFLFTSRVGWCEQVASSLVVLARSVGIPARLATGFVPGERSSLTGRFTVRERDAHAWTEIYFPGVGWQAFDPTAQVPLAGEASPSKSLLERARDNVVMLAIAAGLFVAALLFGPRLLAGWRARRHRRAWAPNALDRLEHIGRVAGRPRSAAETPREYAGALAVRLDEPSVVMVGQAVDADAFSSTGIGDGARRAADDTLRAAESQARAERRRRWWAQLTRRNGTSKADAGRVLRSSRP